MIDAVSLSTFVSHGEALESHHESLHAVYHARDGRQVTYIKGDVGQAVEGSCRQLLDFPSFRRAPGDTEMRFAGNVRDILAAWKHSFRCPLSLDPPCLWTLWEPLAALVLMREWKSLACVIPEAERARERAQAHIAGGLGCTSALSEADDDEGALQQSIDDLLATRHFDSLSDTLRRWAPSILQDDAGRSTLLAAILKWSDRAACSCDEIQPRRSASGRAGHKS